MKRTAVSLFIDDTHFLPQGAFGEVMDFLEAEGVRGKVSAMPGYDSALYGSTLGQSDEPVVLDFVAEVARVGTRGFDLHMELMTHQNLWDFQAGVEREDGAGPHESIWLMEPGVPVAEYQAYFAGILDNVKPRGVTFNGMTLPGCLCEACLPRLQALGAEGHSRVSDNAFQALLNLAEQGRFGVPVVAVFIDRSDATHPTRMVAERGGFGVYDARMDFFVEDQVGFDGPEVDFYITEDGRGGRIPELVLGGAEQCFFCAHWYEMNPAMEPGKWASFQEIIRRINATLGDRIEWVKPSEYGQRLMLAGRLAGGGGR